MEQDEKPWIVKLRKGWFSCITHQYYPTYEEALAAHTAAQKAMLDDCPF